MCHCIFNSTICTTLRGDLRHARILVIFNRTRVVCGCCRFGQVTQCSIRCIQRKVRLVFLGLSGSRPIVLGFIHCYFCNATLATSNISMWGGVVTQFSLWGDLYIVGCLTTLTLMAKGVQGFLHIKMFGERGVAIFGSGSIMFYPCTMSNFKCIFCSKRVGTFCVNFLNDPTKRELVFRVRTLFGVIQPRNYRFIGHIGLRVRDLIVVTTRLFIAVLWCMDIFILGGNIWGVF